MDQQMGRAVAQDQRRRETEPRIEISKLRVTQLLVAMVVAIHVLNIPAVAFKYVWPEYWAWTRHYVVLLSVSVLATLEEILEMSGMVLFLYSLMDHLERYAPESRIRVCR